MADATYEKLRSKYKPKHIKWLLVTESPPPAGGSDKGTRHFYEDGRPENDRLFWNTMRAIYPEAHEVTEMVLARDKVKWLERFAADGFYLIESLEQSLPHGTKTSERHAAIKAGLPELVVKINKLAEPDTEIILIKSTTYKMAAETLKEAKINVVNQGLIDYPGYWREQQFVAKLSALIKKN
ncbi:MAG TPA: hypothetical protein VLF21_02140 [Candidatus Saccharimonadales bacterium]|nr:hypothetical protein [Candidatus Saccharimonadales bacterium]